MKEEDSIYNAMWYQLKSFFDLIGNKHDSQENSLK